MTHMERPQAQPLSKGILRLLQKADRIDIQSKISKDHQVVSADIIVLRENSSNEVHRYKLDPVPAYASCSRKHKDSLCERHPGGVIGTVLHVCPLEQIPTALGTVLACLKVGDKLTLEWCDNSSPLLEEKGMVMDMLNLRVHRPRKGKSDQILVFPLDYMVTMGDSSARWIRR